MIFVTACGQLPVEKPSLVLKHDAVIEVDGQVKQVRANESFEIEDGKTIKITAPGKTPLIFFHAKRAQKSAVELPRLSDLTLNDRLNISLNRKLDDLMPQIQEVQQLILREDYNNAISKVRDLKMKYPGIAYLSFLESACYQVQGRESEALKILSEGLGINPESKEGKAMYRSISGREVR